MYFVNKRLTIALATKSRLIVFPVYYIKPKDLIAGQTKCFCFLYKQLVSKML